MEMGETRWIKLASRVVGGESMVDIAGGEKCGTTTVRQMVLKAFRARNPMLYESLRQRMKGGCYREPSMKLLVEHAGEFGIGPSVKESW